MSNAQIIYRPKKTTGLSKKYILCVGISTKGLETWDRFLVADVHDIAGVPGIACVPWPALLLAICSFLANGYASPLFLASHASRGLSRYWLIAVIGRPCYCWSPYCCWYLWCLSARMYSDHQWVLQYCASSYPLAFERFHIHTSPQVLEEGSEVQCLKTFCFCFSPISFYKSHYAGVFWLILKIILGILQIYNRFFVVSLAVGRILVF